MFLKPPGKVWLGPLPVEAPSKMAPGTAMETTAFGVALIPSDISAAWNAALVVLVSVTFNRRALELKLVTVKVPVALRSVLMPVAVVGSLQFAIKDCPTAPEFRVTVGSVW